MFRTPSSTSGRHARRAGPIDLKTRNVRSNPQESAVFARARAQPALHLLGDPLHEKFGDHSHGRRPLASRSPRCLLAAAADAARAEAAAVTVVNAKPTANAAE